MRAVIQRVSEASVTIDSKVVSSIKDGLLILIGIEENDDQTDIEWLSRKIIHLRIFEDDNGVMNKSILDINGEAIIVSQFTLHASTKKGNRPSYLKAAKPDIAIPLYEGFVEQFKKDFGKEVGTGIFAADMKISLLNDGPVTIIVDTKSKE